MSDFDYEEWIGTGYQDTVSNHGGELFAYRVSCDECDWTVRRSFSANASSAKNLHEERHGHAASVEKDAIA